MRVLQSGQGNDWEESFLTNMAERFQKDGTNTRLSKAQYASLHKVLKLEREPSSRTSAQTNHNPPRPAPKRSTQSYPPRSRPMSVTRAITAPRRAVRRGSATNHGAARYCCGVLRADWILLRFNIIAIHILRIASDVRTANGSFRLRLCDGDTSQSTIRAVYV